MGATTLRDRAAGAIMGAFIGDALACGPHWYYDLSALRRDHGQWIRDYTTPKPGRYHAGLHAVDGGGQNQARAIPAGALVGAQTGLLGIPRRFLDGLEDSARLASLASRLADQLAASAAIPDS